MHVRQWHTVVTLMVLGVGVALGFQAQKKPQPRIIAFGSASPERGTARVGYWDTVKNTGGGGYFVDYGRPVWKTDYDVAAKFDSLTKGNIWRLGNDYWTVFDSNLPVRVSGTEVPAGIWYIGVQRSADGAEWNLVFIESAKVRATRLDPSEIGKAPVAFKAPLKMEQSGTVTEKLTITLTRSGGNLKQSTMKIAWGKYVLTAPIEVAAEL